MLYDNLKANKYESPIPKIQLNEGNKSSRINSENQHQRRNSKHQNQIIGNFHNKIDPIPIDQKSMNNFSDFGKLKLNQYEAKNMTARINTTSDRFFITQESSKAQETLPTLPSIKQALPYTNFTQQRQITSSSSREQRANMQKKSSLLSLGESVKSNNPKSNQETVQDRSPPQEENPEEKLQKSLQKISPTKNFFSNLQALKNFKSQSNLFALTSTNQTAFASNKLTPRNQLLPTDKIIETPFKISTNTSSTPRIQSYSTAVFKKLDPKMINFLKQKSFGKIFDPSTFIQEESMTYEDEIDGQEAKELFYKKGMKLQKMIEMKKNSPFVQYFNKCNANHVIPQPLGLLSTKRDTDRGKVLSSGCKMGDDYAQALGEGIKVANRGVQVINLCNNRLTDKGALPLLKSLTKDVQELDLSSNPLLSDKSYNYIYQILNMQEFKLKVLKLEKNNIADRVCSQLCEALDQNPTTKTLSFLSLSHNNITCLGVKSIAEMLKYNTSITVLFLNWNKIGYKGGIYITQVLLTNQGIQVLDLSYNSMGSSLQSKYNSISFTPRRINPNTIIPKTEVNSTNNNNNLEIPTYQFSSFTQQISQNAVNNIVQGTNMKPEVKKQLEQINMMSESFKQMFIQNKTLIHLDLSYNGFRRLELQTMNEGLKENHTILGLHLQGNEMNTDSMGFVSIDSEEKQIQQNACSSAHIMSRISPSLEMGKIKKSKVDLHCSSNCWICEGWTQFLFQFNTFKTLHKELDPFTPVYLHLECDNFKPDLMERGVDGVYRLLRMVPPGTLKYYFSIEERDLYAIDQKIARVHQIPSDSDVVQNIVNTNSNRIDLSEISNLKQVTKKIIKVPVTNIIDNIIQSKDLITQTLLEDLTVLIRPPPREPPTRQKEKEPWDFKKSVFAQYQYDTEQILNNCFEFDWECSKIPKIIKVPEEQALIKTLLRKHYKHIREAYKYYSAISPSGGVFSIGALVFQDIVNNIQIIDKDNCKLSDIDMEFITTNAGVKVNKYNPDRALVRYQLMEIFVRLAIQKFLKSKEAKNVVEAVEKMFDNHIYKFIKQFDCHSWRSRLLWCEDCDIIFKSYMPVIKMLFKTNSGKYTKPGFSPFMSLEEFTDLITNTGVTSDSLGQREIGIHFYLSKQTEINELDYDKNTQMMMIEFIEAIGRIADKLSVETLQSRMIIDEEEESVMESEQGFFTEVNNSPSNIEQILVEQKQLSYKIEMLIKLLMDTNLNTSSNTKAMRKLNQQVTQNKQRLSNKLSGVFLEKLGSFKLSQKSTLLLNE